MIEVSNLIKCFGNHVAVAGLDFGAEQGDILGLIGPNGAGKTTTLRILASLEQPDAGDVRLAGVDILRDVEKARKVVGFMPERFGLYDELSVRDYLDFFARILNLSYDERRRRVDDLIELCDLKSKIDSGCGTLSKGVRQRLFVAKTLLSDPPVMLLDEPASGLDPRARIEFRELLKELSDHGKTILISSHILSELDAICTAIVIVEQGRVQFTGNVQELSSQLHQQSIVVRLLNNDQSADLMSWLSLRDQVENCEQLEDRQGRFFRFEHHATKDFIPALLKDLLAADFTVFSFQVEAAGLESLFLKVTEGLVS